MYFGTFLALCILRQLQVYSYTYDTILGHQYLSTTNCLVDPKSHFSTWSRNIFSAITLKRPSQTNFGLRGILLNNCPSQMRKLFRHLCAFFSKCSSLLRDIALHFLQTSINKYFTSTGVSSADNTRSSSSCNLSVVSSCFEFVDEKSVMKMRAPLYTPFRVRTR